MRIEATVREIRALVQLAGLDAEAKAMPPETYRKQREACSRRVIRALRERYLALAEAGRSPAVAAIDRGGCSVCHLRLPTMVESQARRAPGIYTCPHCRRMLYSPELLATPDPDEAKQGTAPRNPHASAVERP